MTTAGIDWQNLTAASIDGQNLTAAGIDGQNLTAAGIDGRILSAAGNAEKLVALGDNGKMIAPGGVAAHEGSFASGLRSGGRLLLIGGGGHAASVCDAILSHTAHSDIGAEIAVIDKREKVGSSVCGVKVIGVDGDLGRLRDRYELAFISLGGVGNRGERERLYRLAAGFGYRFPNIAHARAHLSPLAECGSGIFTGFGAFANAGCILRDFCILNTGCIVEHGCVVEPFAHVAPGAVLCGGARIGAGAHIGAGAVVLQGVAVGSGSIVGAGSVVTRDVPDGVVAYGNPCRVRESRSKEDILNNG